MFWLAGPAQAPDAGASLAPPLPDPTLPQPGNAKCGWVVLRCRCSIGLRVSGVAQETTYHGMHVCVSLMTFPGLRYT